MLIVGACLGVFTFIELGVDCRRGQDYCPRCGAISRVGHLEVVGFGGELSRRVQAGPISQFIQSQTGQCCAHRWQFMNCTGGGVLFRYIADGSHPCALQWFFEQSPGVQAFLKQEVARDPGFLSRLQVAVGRRDDPTYAFWEDLANRAYGLEPNTPATRPATRPSTPTTRNRTD